MCHTCMPAIYCLIKQNERHQNQSQKWKFSLTVLLWLRQCGCSFRIRRPDWCLRQFRSVMRCHRCWTMYHFRRDLLHSLERWPHFDKLAVVVWHCIRAEWKWADNHSHRQRRFALWPQFPRINVVYPNPKPTQKLTVTGHWERKRRKWR